jgi:hypothetical protein
VLCPTSREETGEEIHATVAAATAGKNRAFATMVSCAGRQSLEWAQRGTPSTIGGAKKMMAEPANTPTTANFRVRKTNVSKVTMTRITDNEKVDNDSRNVKRKQSKSN